MDTDLFSQANCKGQTHLFFAPPAERPPARIRRTNAAIALCKTCPAAAACAAYAEAQGEQYGIWGGIDLEYQS